MPALVHLIYASAATEELTPSDLSSMLEQARRNNARDNISGMLLHANGSFFQVLEGHAEAVDAVYARIAGDPRHAQATCIIHEPIASRAFRDWTMGFSELGNQQAAEIVGYNDFYDARTCLQTLNPGRARKLLQAFAAGRWHTQLRSAA